MDKDLVKLRKKYNNNILDILNLYLSIYPDIRFTQALYNFDILPVLYSEEPLTTFRKMVPMAKKLIGERFPKNASITQKLFRINVQEAIKDDKKV